MGEVSEDLPSPCPGSDCSYQAEVAFRLPGGERVCTCNNSECRVKKFHPQIQGGGQA